MAKKTAKKTTKRATTTRRKNKNLNLKSNFDSSESNFSTILKDRNYSELAREVINNPTVKYVAGGIAAAVLTRLVDSLSDKYPELSRFLRENVESFEDRLGQYRTGSSAGQESRA